MARTLVDIENDIRRWIKLSGRAFVDQYCDSYGRAWMLKFFPPQYLAGFMRRPELVVSATPGYTWGDGVYVVPLKHAYSAMIYGRVGVMGWIGNVNILNIYDAGDLSGLLLYQEWIQLKPGLFRLLTTTIHSPLANRRLRNAFKSRFNVDLVIFCPDEFNRAYVQPLQDRWCVISDFSISSALPAGTVGFSTRICDCELVVIGTEEFAVNRSGVVRHDQIGPQVSSPTAVRVASTRPSLTQVLMNTYQWNRTRANNPPRFVLSKP